MARVRSLQKIPKRRLLGLMPAGMKEVTIEQDYGGHDPGRKEARSPVGRVVNMAYHLRDWALHWRTRFMFFLRSTFNR